MYMWIDRPKHIKSVSEEHKYIFSDNKRCRFKINAIHTMEECESWRIGIEEEEEEDTVNELRGQLKNKHNSLFVSVSGTTR